MITVTYLPLFVTVLFREMPGIWKSHHRLILCWLVCMQALYPGRKTLAELARWTPAQVTMWRFRRLLKAAYWDIQLLVKWWVQEALNPLPPPQDGTVYLVGTAVTSRNGAHRILWGKKDAKASISPGFSGSALSC